MERKMSRWKKILTAAVLSIVVLIVAIYAFLSLYDFNKFKPMLARTVKNATGRELTIAGNIEFDLGIRPTLIVEDVSLQNASWSSSPQLANVKRMEIQIAALPLIIGKFDFVRLVLIEPHIIVEFDSKGTSNFSFDTNGEEIDESKTAPPPFMFSDLLIENGKFAYRDEQSDFNFSVIIDRLTAEIPGFTKPLQLVFKGAYNDIPLNLNGSLGPIWAWIEPGYSMPADLTVAAGGATNTRGDPFPPIPEARWGQFTLEDFYEQIEQVQGMGSLSQITKMIPGFSKLGKKLPGGFLDVQEEKMKKFRFIIDSMTPEEKRNPEERNR